tara:strand:+ start:124 stop:846 length:723 start_codon:yes stop_codon:yes gene_type:complete
MTNDTYLYFSDDFTKTKASTTTADQLVTIADGAPFTAMMDMDIVEADRTGGTGFFHNGLVSLKLNAANIGPSDGTEHKFGSHYGTVVNDAEVEVHPQAAIYAAGSSDGDFTLKTVAQDAVYGITQSSTAGENGFTLTLNRPYLNDQVVVKSASTIIGMQTVDATNTKLSFGPSTGDDSAIDSVTLTHASNKHHLLVASIADVIADPRSNGKVVKFADGFNEIYFDGNPAGITTVTLAIDG